MKRALRYLGLAALWLVLFVYFAYLRFPYDRARPVLDRELADLGTVRISYDELGPVLFGFGVLRLEGVQLDVGGAGDAAPLRVPIERLDISPSLLSALRGGVAVDFDARLFDGSADGTVTAGKGEPTRLRLELDDLDLAAAPLPGVEGLEGRVEGEVELTLRGAGGREASGEIALRAFDGVIPKSVTRVLPQALRFDSVEADVVLEPGPQLQVRSLRVEGPDVEGEVEASIGLRPLMLARSRLEADIRFKIVSPELRDLEGLLTAVPNLRKEAGMYKLKLRGTLGNPRPS